MTMNSCNLSFFITHDNLPENETLARWVHTLAAVSGLVAHQTPYRLSSSEPDEEAMALISSGVPYVLVFAKNIYDCPSLMAELQLATASTVVLHINHAGVVASCLEGDLRLKVLSPDKQDDHALVAIKDVVEARQTDDKDRLRVSAFLWLSAWLCVLSRKNTKM